MHNRESSNERGERDKLPPKHVSIIDEVGERVERTKRLAAAATALPPTQWFLDQLNALVDQPS